MKRDRNNDTNSYPIQNPMTGDVKDRDRTKWKAGLALAAIPLLLAVPGILPAADWTPLPDSGQATSKK